MRDFLVQVKKRKQTNKNKQTTNKQTNKIKPKPKQTNKTKTKTKTKTKQKTKTNIKQGNCFWQPYRLYKKPFNEKTNVPLGVNPHWKHNFQAFLSHLLLTISGKIK